MADGVPPPGTWGPLAIDVRDGRLWATLPDLEAAPDGRGPAITRPVGLVTGSHHQQVFWYETGRARLLGRFPLTYLVAERRWIPRTAAFLQPPAPALVPGTGQWNQVCISCHTTGGEPRVPDLYARLDPETMTADSRVAEFGIACESCHGPGAAHARAPRDGHIVNPRRLDPRRSAEVCGQCHSVWEWPDQDSQRAENLHGPAFRPGDVLAQSRFVAHPAGAPDAPRLGALLADDPDFVREAFWPDGTIAVAGREYNGLLDSPCFVRATTPDRTLTCLSCHALHPDRDDPRPLEAWADAMLGPERDGNGTCLSCHGSLTGRESRHSRHAEVSSGNRCVNCHMPFTTYGLLGTHRSHRISIPDPSATATTGKPDACTLCHLDRPEGWAGTALATWAGKSPAASSQTVEGVPTAVRLALSGDAQQRAVLADAFGRRDVSALRDPSWTVPVLATLLDDPYPAVRFIARRALAAVDGPIPAGYDFLAPRDARMRAKQEARAAWRTRAVRSGWTAVPDTVLDGLTAERNDRRVALRE